MNKIAVVIVALVTVAANTGAVVAQPRHEPPPRYEHGRQQRMPDHRDPRYAEGHEWRRGERIAHDDWDRGRHVDYREHRLRPPPRGYEWREVDDRFIMVAIATGLIASVVLRHR